MKKIRSIVKKALKIIAIAIGIWAFVCAIFAMGGVMKWKGGYIGGEAGFFKNWIWCLTHM